MQKHEPEGKNQFLIVLLITLTIAMALFTVTSAMTNYTLVKPFILTNVSTAPVNAKLQSMSFAYNTTTSQYTNATISIKNEGTSALLISVAIEFYDVQNIIVVSGQEFVGSISPQGTFFVIIKLTWVEGKKVTDIASGKITLIPGGV